MSQLKKIVKIDDPQVADVNKKARMDFIEIPPKQIFNSDLHNLKGYNHMRIGLKNKKKFIDFVDSLTNLVDLLPVDKYDSDLVQTVCQFAEDHFTRRKSGQLKSDAVILVCKKYYQDDEELVKSIINLVLPKIKRSTFLRRNKKRISNFFFSLVCMFWGR